MTFLFAIIPTSLYYHLHEEQLAIYNEGKRLLLLVRNELKEEFEVIDCIDWLNTR